MCDTLNNIDGSCQHGFGEYLIVNKAVYHNFFGWNFRDPQRGDIVVFKPPQSEDEYYIKRVIGQPGEEVEIKDGAVYVYNENYPDGFKIPEYYLSDRNSGKTYMFTKDMSRFKITEDHYFVLGDNRQESTDSRTCFLPPLSKECSDGGRHLLAADRIEGKAMLVLWPFNKIRLLGNPSYVVAAH